MHEILLHPYIYVLVYVNSYLFNYLKLVGLTIMWLCMLGWDWMGYVVM